ncbi:MAG: FecCD family ABC transporter permease [Candidatus Eisenbacteria bacterium]
MRRTVGLLLLALAGAFLASLLFGPANVPPSRILAGLLDPGRPESETARILVRDLRLPRAIAAVLSGAALAISGALLQSYFANPMAGPYVTGVSSGAGLAVAVVAVVAGSGGPPSWATPAAALAGALLLVSLVAFAASRSRSSRTETLLLIGLAVASIGSALMSILLLHLPRGPEGVLFWLMGSLASSTGAGNALLAIALGVGLLAGLWHARALDAILWGDETARSVGVEVRRTRALALIAATILAAASVATCGVIGFLGLMAPHIARGLVGPGHGRLLPASALVGAVTLLLADLGARLLLAPAELPVGAITSAVGAPFLIWISLRRRGSWDSSAGTRRRSSPKRTSTSSEAPTTKRASASRRS